MKVLFAGPSLSKDLPQLRMVPDFILAAPAACGDVAKATVEGATAVGIVDGYFEATRAIWHKEVLFALWSGVRVAGAASMGALRAAECSSFGMIGIGEVFSRYASGNLVDDADVAQIHAPAELDYLSLSDPWVNVEPTIRKMVAAAVIDTSEFELLHAVARRFHYKERTYRAIFESLGQTPPERLAQMLSWVAAHGVDQKRLDALELVDWLVSQNGRRETRHNWRFSETSQWRKLLVELGLSPEPVM